MKLAVRTAKLDAITVRLLSSLELVAQRIVAIPTNYHCITLPNLNESIATFFGSIHNFAHNRRDEGDIRYKQIIPPFQWVQRYDYETVDLKG